MITIKFEDEQDLENWIMIKLQVLVRTKPGGKWKNPFTSHKAQKKYEEGLIIELLKKAEENENN